MGPISADGLEEYFIQVRSRFERNDQKKELSESEESAAFSSSLLLRQVEDAGDSAVICEKTKITLDVSPNGILSYIIITNNTQYNCYKHYTRKFMTPCRKFTYDFQDVA